MKNEFKAPEYSDIIISALLEYKNRFLKINNLNVGDVVEFSFMVDEFRPKFRSRGQEKVSFSKMLPAIIKEDLNGVIYFETVNNVRRFEYVGNDNYKEYPAKAIATLKFNQYYEIKL